MLEFIQLLKQGYQAIINQASSENGLADNQRRIGQLLLAEAFLRKGQWLNHSRQPALQIAVIGPTQAGKSSLVNVLLNDSIAGVSPLAGYTQHPQGFCHNLNADDCQSLQSYFGRFQQLPLNQLSNGRHDCYALSECQQHSELLPNCVLWDTPDFDSIDASTYREGVLRTIALADVVILVVSKEKYADQSVWEMMALLADLHQPTLICLNKLADGSESVLIASLQEKWQQVRADKFPDVVPLHYQKHSGLSEWPQNQRNLIKQLCKSVQHSKQSRYEQALLQKYWSAWLEPVLQQHQAVAEWQGLVDAAIKEALVNYRRDYLDHPHHYETFQQAMAELLTLLEIPGLAGFLTGARKVMTWPIRQMMKLGKKRQHITDSSQEVLLLNQIAEHLLIQLADQLMEKAEQNRHSAWWKAFNGLLRKQRLLVLQQFSHSAKSYHLDFQQDVEQTAQQLYKKLQEQPLVLNSLRATRVTADAAAIAITLHTGGIGLHDLVIAPAMLTVTTLLTESAIGSYLHKVQHQLKQQQLDTVKQTLFMDSIHQQLMALPAQLSDLVYFSISPAQVQAAQSQLSEKRHGLRLL
ncbi:hypothetical protein JCM14076_29800 [Methylosoma difficile]